MRVTCVACALIVCQNFIVISLSVQSEEIHYTECAPYFAQRSALTRSAKWGLLCNRNAALVPPVYAVSLVIAVMIMVLLGSLNVPQRQKNQHDWHAMCIARRLDCLFSCHSRWYMCICVNFARHSTQAFYTISVRCIGRGNIFPLVLE